MMKRLSVFLAGLSLVGLGMVGWFVFRDAGDPIPDEKRVAMIELQVERSGPRYFHPDDPAAVPDEQGIVWMAPDKAAGQIDRVLRERMLDESARPKLAKLIDEITEPHPSRVIGGYRVNVARLNVALDAMK